MVYLRCVIFISLLTFSILNAESRQRHIVVADSATHSPLANASVFDARGNFIGMSRTNGQIYAILPNDYPLTVRYLGYREKQILQSDKDTVFLIEKTAELPDVVVEAKQKRLLHILAYVREYSTLSSYSDTITMFREKMVDFMLPHDSKVRFQGWKYPRILKSESYYRFTNALGLDSVSDRCNHYFTWSDWVGLFPTIHIPPKLSTLKNGIDSLSGKYNLYEIWRKNGERVTIDINVLADTISRRWVPNLFSFFNNDETDFERFNLRINYDNVIDSKVSPSDLVSYSFNIESRGRGRQMFKFNRRDEPLFVSTYTEVYIIDKEFISIKEAKEWDNRTFSSDDIEIIEPDVAPELQPSVLALIERVNSINEAKVRLSLKPDHHLKSRNSSKRNSNIGNRALSLMKQLTGITYYKSRKNFNKGWKDFLSRRKHQAENTDTIAVTLNEK